MALAARPGGEQPWLEYWQEALRRVVGWPAGLVVTAIDAMDGSRIAFDATSAIGLAEAVAASTAVPLLFPPITVGQRRYIDGGGGSQTNADLARGHDEILIVAPVDRGQLTVELQSLEDSGAKVMVIRPSAAGQAALGMDLSLL